MMLPSIGIKKTTFHLTRRLLSIAAFIGFAFLLFMQTAGASLQQTQQPSDLISFVPIPIAVPLNTDSNKSTIIPNSEGNSIPNNPSITQAATCQKLPVPSVTAIGNDGNVPANVLDNNLNARWSNNGVGSWIQLDLGAKKDICSVDIAWHRGGGGRINNFAISFSNDGVNFSSELQKQNSGTTSSLERYAMPTGTEARYVKITVNGIMRMIGPVYWRLRFLGVISILKLPSVKNWQCQL
jgi:F5/8 type C domain-containing protein